MVDPLIIKEISRKMEHNRIIPTKPILDEKLKEKLKTLSFCTIWQF